MTRPILPGESLATDAIYNMDALDGLRLIADGTLDAIITDPPYNLGKDFGNSSDARSGADFLDWTFAWLDLAVPKLKETGTLFIFATWQYSPEIFVHLKQRMVMINEIIWDRRVPSMGGTTRKFSSVHDNIGFFARSRNYHFDLDAVRIPYDAETKKARSRSIFVGKKWLEQGFNPKDVWSVARLHRIHGEREAHPTQKPLEIIERMVLAGTPRGGLVLDPFMGSGTTALACRRTGRQFIGFEINPEYCRMAEDRLERAAALPSGSASGSARKRGRKTLA